MQPDQLPVEPDRGRARRQPEHRRAPRGLVGRDHRADFPGEPHAGLVGRVEHFGGDALALLRFNGGGNHDGKGVAEDGRGGLAGMAPDDGLHLGRLRLHAAHQGKLRAGAVEIVFRPPRLEVNVALEEIGEEPETDFKGDEPPREGQVHDLGCVEQRTGGCEISFGQGVEISSRDVTSERSRSSSAAEFVAERTMSPKSYSARPGITVSRSMTDAGAGRVVDQHIVEFGVVVRRARASPCPPAIPAGDPPSVPLRARTLSPGTPRPPAPPCPPPPPVATPRTAGAYGGSSNRLVQPAAGRSLSSR